jgi:hypothetical protein
MRADVTQVKCDRCGRTELVPLQKQEDGKKEKDPDLALAFLGDVLVIKDACSRCKELIRRHVDAIRDLNEKVKTPLGPTVPPNEGVSLMPEPKYATPATQAHSPASAKR